MVEWDSSPGCLKGKKKTTKASRRSSDSLLSAFVAAYRLSEAGRHCQGLSGALAGQAHLETLPFITFPSNGQNKGWTRIADSCIAEDSLEKLATNPARITKPP